MAAEQPSRNASEEYAGYTLTLEAHRDDAFHGAVAWVDVKDSGQTVFRVRAGVTDQFARDRWSGRREALDLAAQFGLAKARHHIEQRQFIAGETYAQDWKGHTDDPPNAPKTTL